MSARRRLDAELVRRSIAPSRAEAVRLIEARRVTVGGVLADKAARLVAAGDAVEVLGPPRRYVSRGGLKLEAALDEFHIDPAGLRVLDAGASTGGFTDCVLQRGAAEVVAVDVGYGQLHEKLRADARVVSRERLHVRDVSPEAIGGMVDLIVGDLSFISLTKVLAPIRALLTPQADVVALVKPQFEVGKGDVGKGGIVKSPEKHQQAVAAVRACAESVGFAALGVTESPIKGAKGNAEFLMHLRMKRLEGETPQSLKETEARG